MEPFVSFTLVYTCPNGHEYEVEELTAADVDDYSFFDADTCHERRGIDCTENPTLDRVEMEDSR